MADNNKSLGMMLDIESLDTGPRSVVLQIAIVPFMLDDEEFSPDFVLKVDVPFPPQLDLVNPRTISANTILWWMQQSAEARQIFERVAIDDMFSLRTIGAHIVTQWGQMTHGFDHVELWARGPQFDAVNVESLLKDLGHEAPWEYSKVRDLRTLMAQAGIKSADVPKDSRFVAHDAYWDCRHQIACYHAANRVLHRTA